ncbi:C4-dicarboxylate ABC transporter substrate-binding protein [Thioclava sp. SK-1]|uniref:TRAP transporter small permease n=1 Tax=Thioclava sp. SK-1 TaxID=1889770 RepID=UPI000825358F|nr:TRAP transporter small permease subunit [Thioclava sp. SK-1]OCX67358.1 C4-dicarboxylate ABC transporter substrate-binding protein [Thioclava sp. SK-1]
MQALINGVRRILGFAAGLSMALVFSIIFINSLRRYMVGQSVPWGEELPIYLTIYGVMFGLALGYLGDNHIRFTILIDMISKKTREWLFLAVDVITFASGLGLAYAGHAFAMRRGSVDASGLKSTGRWLAETTGIDALVWIGKVGTWQYAIAIGGVLLAIAAVLKFIERLGTLRRL